ncbi:MAG TPA: T9SS type A sorting domain-containing protein, partial [bacterium]|nr:T9SS type A sorting domain-containing protein [bacterium]
QFGSIDPVFYSAWNFDTRKNVTAVERTGNWIPTEFSIAQNYPNPFNPSTVIAYNLAKPAEVKLMVYNLLGNRVATLVNSRQTAGSYKVTWNAMDDWGRPVSAGIYFYRIEAGENVKMLKMMLIK